MKNKQIAGRKAHGARLKARALDERAREEKDQQRQRAFRRQATLLRMMRGS